MRIPQDGQATFVLQDKNGQTVRVLAQAVPVRAGDYEIPFDGLDLWGNLLPENTELTLHTITHPGIRAIYEMAVGSSGNPAWLTGRIGEGDAARQGGNLGDHTGPNTVCAVGDKLFLGSALVEHGHNVIATTAKGEKLWGIQIEGWTGPGQMSTDGKQLFIITRGNTKTYSVDPETFKVTRLFDTAPDQVVSFTAHNDQLLMVLKNSAADKNPFARGKINIDWAKSMPTAQGNKAPEWQIGPQAMISNVFTQGGHFQTGFVPPAFGKDAHVLSVFTQPQPVGAVLYEKIENTREAEIFALKPGVAYDAAKHKPTPDAPLHADWLSLGKPDAKRQVDVVTAPQADFKTNAVFMKFTPDDAGQKLGRLAMARLQPIRVARVPADIRVMLPDEAAQTPEANRITKGRGVAAGWDVRTELPITDVAPLTVTLDLGKTQQFDGLSLLNFANTQFEIYALDDNAAVASAREDQWQLVKKVSAPTSKSHGPATSYATANDWQIEFDARIKTAALRLKITSGIAPGRGPVKLAEDPQRAACGDVMLLQVVDPQPKVPSHVVQRRDTAGKVLSSVQQDLPLRRIAADGANLYGITETSLVKLTLTNDQLTLTPLVSDLKNAQSIAAKNGKIAVGDFGRNAVFIYDAAGKTLATIGNKGPYQRGLYDPNVISRPTGVGFGPDNTLWIAEEAYHPKRIAQFTLEGKHLQDMWGPPEYGGGGHLDPMLTRFYYRGMQFGLDFDKGTWFLQAFNDRYNDPMSPTLDASSFTYTYVSRPIVLNNRTYIVGDPGGGAVINILENNVWRPAAVIAGANNNRFLVGKESWRAHWLKQNLKNKGFIWCDRNGDGNWQVDEVELFDLPDNKLFSAAYWGNRSGRDLTLWTMSMRLAPSRITDRGVPIYESKNIQRFKYDELAPTYLAGLKIGALAKRSFGGATLVAADGTLAIEGQPYRVGPDLKIVGGPVTAKPSDFVPPVAGLIMDNPLGFTGSVVTKSPVGEVAIMNGNNGPWFLWSTKYNVAVGAIFTGAKGGWSGVPNVRGTDVTENKQDWETFFGSFMQANNGKYYVVAGKGHHAISRVEGLDDFKVLSQSVKLSPAAQAENAKLREKLKNAAIARAAAAKDRRSFTAKRAQDVKIDGDLADWGGTKGLQKLRAEEGAADAFAAAAFTDKDLHLAFAGTAVMKNSSQDPAFIFKNGFCLEFAFRSNPQAGGDDLADGDKRLLLAPHKGGWVAVLFDYLNPGVPEEKHKEYASPVALTRVAKVTILPAEAVQVQVKADAPGAKGAQAFTAEAVVALAALGIKNPAGATLRADLGILGADATGNAVEQRWYWSNPNTESITDMALEAAISPGLFGQIKFDK